MEESFDKAYTISRKKSNILFHTEQIIGDVTWETDFSVIEKGSIDLIIYIPSLWSSESDILEKEFEEYMTVWPQWLLRCFHLLNNWWYLKKGALFVSIGSTASESALDLHWTNGSWIYQVSKLAQKSILIQLMKNYSRYKFLNLTLGSIWDWTWWDWGVWYDNIVKTISYTYNAGNSIRYSEVSLVSEMDV